MTSTSAIDTQSLQWSGIDSANPNVRSRTPVTTLDQDDFLKLLVTQMTTQDPLKPMEDLTSFSQLASFSALEQSKATQSSMAMIQANSLLGHYVQVTDPDGNPAVGQVEQVLLIEGEPQLLIGGERFSLGSVAAVSTAPFLPEANPDATLPPNPTTPSTPEDPRLGPAPRPGGAPQLNPAPGTVADAISDGGPRITTDLLGQALRL